LYTLFPEDAVALSLSGFLFSLPCFYVAVAKPQYISASRFVLLTYNLTCLYWYSFIILYVKTYTHSSTLAITSGKEMSWYFMLLFTALLLFWLGFCGQPWCQGSGGQQKHAES
jgi:hypothetical protein